MTVSQELNVTTKVIDSIHSKIQVCAGILVKDFATKFFLTQPYLYYYDYSQNF